MKNSELYKRAFDEVHAPQALLGKVMGMKMEEKKIRRQKGFKTAIAAAFAFIFCIAVSNGVCYAATGSTWMEQITLYINGEKVEKDVTWYETEDGTIYGTFTEESEGEVEGTVYFYDAEQLDLSELDIEYLESGFRMTKDTDNLFVLCGEIKRQDGRLYLTIGSSEIDITEDFADGSCTGTFELAGDTYTYEITGTEDDYDITIK